MYNIFKERRDLDDACCTLFLKNRLKLPVISLPHLFDSFDEQTVRLKMLPRGPWSTPLRDVVVLLKTALCAKPERLMEVGSYRGYTALLLAEHTSDDATIVTVDLKPNHGEAYRNTPMDSKIERRVGSTSPKLFQNDPDGSFEFIFLDAGHKYREVKYDTELLLSLIADDGFFFWHDYANWGYFGGHNGVPEYLNELGAQYPIAHVQGTDLAVYSPSWRNQARKQYVSALTSEKEEDPWSSSAIRG